MANFCSECGVSVASSAIYCSNCGNRLDKDQQPRGEKVLGAPAIGASARTIPANSNGRLKEPSLTSQEMNRLGGGNQNSKTRQFLDDVGGLWGSWRALFAILIPVFFLLWGLVVSQDRPEEALAQEVCDISILGSAPSTPAGRIAWQEFGEKGEQLWEMEGATELGFIGQAAMQLAWATEVEVNLGGGLLSYQDPSGELRPWWEYAGETWQTAGDYWATLCYPED